MALKGCLTVASDKSITHRAIIFSSLAKGTTNIYHPLLGADCLSTLAIFENFGIRSQIKDDCLTITSPGLDAFEVQSSILDAKNSGTTARLLMGVFSYLNEPVTLIGDESLSKRPMGRVMTPLTQMGARIELQDGATLPAQISPSQLSGIDYELPVASAQVKSAMMLAGMLAKGRTTIYEPVPTRDHTEKMFEDFSIQYQKVDRIITIEGPQLPQTPKEVFVPGDISSAAFFIVAALIVPGSHVTIKNVGVNETRSGIIDVIRSMGGKITLLNERYFGGEPVADLDVAYTKDLVATTVEGEMIPRLIDEIPILALLATRASGTTIIKDAEELKVKETNRIDVTVEQLKAIGADIQATEDGMMITGHPEGVFYEANVSSHKDHRIAMMLCVASLLLEKPLLIEDIESMDVSYPDFLKHLQALLEN